MWLAQALPFLIFLHRHLHLIWMNISGSFNLQLTFLHWWPPNQLTWTIRSLELPSRQKTTLSHHQTTKMAPMRQMHLVAPCHIHHASLEKGANIWLPDTQYCLGNSSDFNWRRRSYTTTPTCLAGASGGRHALRWQIWPHKSSCDWPRLGNNFMEGDS